MQEENETVGARIDWLVVGGPVEPWTAIGLDVSDHRVALAGTGIQIAGDEPSGMRALAVSGIDASTEGIDGVPVVVGSRESPPPEGDHPLAALSLDHVVINTDDLERTCEAIAESLDSPLKRVREFGEIRQGFHRVGPSRMDSLIVEVVERPDAPTGQSSLWGFVLIVEDIDAACQRLGPGLVGDPKGAVQPGRQIATIRAEAGLGVPVALMSPDTR